MSDSSYHWRDVLEQVRQAYADSFNRGPDHIERCLNYRTPIWLEPQKAKVAVYIIGDYGSFFKEEDVIDAIDDIAHEDPAVRFSIGREKSPVIYTETVHTAYVMGRLMETGAREVDSVEMTPSPMARTNHDLCKHTSPPCPIDDYVTERPTDADYIRAWWTS